MKTLISIAVLVLVLCLQGCSGNANDVTVWASGDEATSIRLGYFVEENTEIGISSTWWDSDDADPKVVGLYGLRYGPELIRLANPIVLDWLPETISGCPYIGAKLDRNLNLRTTSLSPVFGFCFNDIFVVEHQLKTFEDGGTVSKTTAGVRFRF